MTAAKGTGTFLLSRKKTEKDKKIKKICNLEPRVISAPLKMSRNDPGLEIEKKQFQENNKSNTYKRFIDQVKGQFGRILTQWRICDPQKKLTRKLFFFSGLNPSMTILYSGFLCFFALHN